MVREDALGASMLEGSDYEALLDNLISLIFKLMSSGNGEFINMLDKGLEMASCASSVDIKVPVDDVKLRDIVKLLSDPKVKRGIYILLSFVKLVGECYERSPGKV